MDSRKKRVLFIYEGIKAEETLLNNLVRVFFSSTATISILNCPADGNIYMLWTRLKEDEFETNVVDVLKEMSVIANERLKHFRASDFQRFIFSLIMMGIIIIYPRNMQTVIFLGRCSRPSIMRQSLENCMCHIL